MSVRVHDKASNIFDTIQRKLKYDNSKSTIFTKTLLIKLVLTTKDNLFVLFWSLFLFLCTCQAIQLKYCCHRVICTYMHS